ncbi:MAG: hypothetical protein ABI619_03350 [Betaproteobacteria bacterium]
MNRNRTLKLISITALFLLSACANAARVESDDVQNYGSNPNKTRAVISAQASPETGRCDFADPVANQTNGLSTREAFGRAMCHQV